MADIQKKSTQPPLPNQPLFDPTDIISAPSLVDANAIYNDAMTSLDQKNISVNISGMQQKSQLLDTTVRTAQEVFKSNEQTMRQLTTAQQRRSQIEKIPPIIGRVLGLFDKDYDWGHWNEQVRGAKNQLAVNDQQLTQLQMLSQLQEDVINNSLAQTQVMYQTLSQGYSRALDVRKVQMEEEQRLFNNRLQLSQEGRAQAQFKMNEVLFQQGQEDRAVTMLDDATLEAAANGQIEGINQAAAQRHKFARQREKLDLQQAAIGIAQGDIDLENEGRTRFLSSQPAEVLTDLAERAKANGGNIVLNTEHGAVPFTQKELSRAAAQIATDDQTAKNAVTDQLITMSQLKDNTDTLMNTALQISHATGSQGFHPKTQRLLQESMSAIQAAVDAGNPQRAAEIAKQSVVDMDKIAEDVIKAAPDKQQPFIRSRFNNTVPTQDDINNYLGDAVWNPAAMNQAVDTKLAPMWKRISEEAKKISSSSISFGRDAEGNVVIGGGEDMNRGRTMQTALGNVMNDTETQIGVQSQFMQSRDVDAYNSAMTELSGKVAWMQGIQSIHQFMDYNSGNFQPDRFLKYLRDKYVQDVESGKIPVAMQDSGAIRPYDKQFLDYMRRPEFQMKLAKSWGEFSVQGDALFQSITGGDPLVGYMMNLYQTENGFEASYAANALAINKMTSPDLAQFRRRYAAQINFAQEDIMKNDPSKTPAKAREEAEKQIYLQIQSQQQQIIQQGTY